MKVFGQFGHGIRGPFDRVNIAIPLVYQTLHASDTTESFLAKSGHRPEIMEIPAELWLESA